jgi:hypothetical protein
MLELTCVIVLLTPATMVLEWVADIRPDQAHLDITLPAGTAPARTAGPLRTP